MAKKQAKQIQKAPKKSKKWAVALTTILALGAGAGAGYGIATATAKKTNPEIEKEHKIDVPSSKVEGYQVNVSPSNAKMGDVVTFTVTKNSNGTKVPKAIRIFATNDKGEEVSSDYPLRSNGSGLYYANVTITYISNMRTELIFEEAAKKVVSFDSAGGSAVSSISVDEGGYITEPAKPTKEHYTFKYWHTKDSSLAFDFTHTPINENITLYAEWEANTYTITWKNDDGSVIDTTNVVYNNLPTHADPTKPATAEYTYVFTGWTPSIAIATANATYQATFASIKNEYTVTFVTDGGTYVNPVTAKYGSTIAEPTTTKEGHTFTGWYYNDGGEEKKWNFTSDTVKSNITLTAHWTVNKYTVSFDSMGGSVVPSSTNVEWNTSIAKPTNPTRTDYDFVCWMYNGQEFKFSNDANPTLVKGNITLTAKWAAAPYFDVTFNVDGGTAVAAQSIQRDHLVNNPGTTATTKTGYTFKGWYDKPSSDQSAKVWDFANNKITSATTIYAHWDINTYTVTYDAAGGSDVASAQVQYNNTIATSPTTTRTHYTFDGWYNGDTKWVFGTDGTKVTGNVTLVARWIPVETYTVSFDTQGGSLIDTQTVYKGDKATQPASDPTKEGYTFNGWFNQATGGSQFDFANTPITAKTTIYAQWTAKTCSVEFKDSVTGTSLKTTSTNYGEAVKTADVPTPAVKSGYIYKGWSKKADVYEAFDITQPITDYTNTTTIYAYYEATTVVGIELVQNPTKMVYPVGATASNIDLTNLIVKLLMSDGSATTVTDFSTSEWSKAFASATSATGPNIIKLTYTKGSNVKTVDITCYISNQYVDLTIVNHPVTTIVKGGTFSPKGLEVQLSDYTGQGVTPTIKWGTDDLEEHKDDGYTVSDIDTSTVGDKLVTVTRKADTTTLDDLTVSFYVSVVEQYKSLTILTEPTTTQYQKKSTFSPIGLKVELTDYAEQTQTFEWTNDSTPSGFTITGADSTAMSTTGFKTVTVKHDASGLTATFTIFVSEAYYTVNFYLNDGSADTSKILYTENVQDGTKVTKPKDPTSVLGGVFAGWYKDADCTEKYNFDTAVTANPGNAYAKWTDGFNGVDWETVAVSCDWYETKSTPTLQNAQTLCALLGIDASSETGTATQCLQNKVVGLQGVVTINDVQHVVRCIDAMHDDLWDGTKVTGKATFTFELVTLLSDSNGSAVTSIYGGNCRDYPTSTLRTKLTNLVSSLPTVLANSVKTVQKSVTLYPDGTPCSITTYTDKLFALTYTEMAQSGSVAAKVEGEVYKYWNDHNENEYRKKYDKKGNVYKYWLSSPYINDPMKAWFVYIDGKVWDQDVRTTDAEAISFAFCL